MGKGIPTPSTHIEQHSITAAMLAVLEMDQETSIEPGVVRAKRNDDEGGNAI
jgi:hypothetical protein